MVLLGSRVNAQLAEEAPDVAESVAYVALGPQSHQLVGLYQGAPSAMQLGTEAEDELNPLLDPLLELVVEELPVVPPPIVVVPDGNVIVYVPGTGVGVKSEVPGAMLVHPPTPLQELLEVVVVVLPVTEHPERVE